jgi:hypothetical protein
LMLTCSTTVGRTPGHTDVSLWYVVKSDRHRSLQWSSDEFNAVRWFGLTDAPVTRSDPHLGRFLRKYASGSVRSTGRHNASRTPRVSRQPGSSTNTECLGRCCTSWPTGPCCTVTWGEAGGGTSRAGRNSRNGARRRRDLR